MSETYSNTPILEQVFTDLPNVIQTRSNEDVVFKPEKIHKAILKAGKSTEEFGGSEASLLCTQVLKIVEHKFRGRTPQVEEIQDIVEHILLSANHFKTAKAYILYRENRRKLRSDMESIVQVESSINEYLDKVDYSLGGLILNVSGKVIANYWLNHVYAPEVAEVHRNGDLHVHDLDMLAGYCAGWSLKTLLQEGFNGVPGKTESNPPKHLSSAIGQVVNFLGTLQNEWAGSQAFSSFDTYLAPYVKNDDLSYDEVKQCIQELICDLNVPSRWGTQTPFTNLTFDWTCPKDLASEQPIVAGKVQDYTYGDLQKEMDLINKAFIEVMMKGDSKDRVFTFPIPTYNIDSNFDWDNENADLLFEMTAKYGLPYFQNFTNSDLKPEMIRSMHKQPNSDLGELQSRGNGLFGSAEQTGSVGVVTVNMARLGYVYQGDRTGLFKRLDELLDLACASLEVKRKEIQKHIEQGLLPFTRRYLSTLKKHFSTIGVNGINELIRNYSYDEWDISDEKGKEFGEEILDHIRAKMVEYQKRTGNLFNLEATPAESTTYRFAKEDKRRFPLILQAGTEKKPYYTNSSQLPVSYSDDPFEVLSHQENLQQKYTGGTALHLYMGEALSSSDAAKVLIKRSLTNYRIPYVTLTPTFSICPEHGYLSGAHEYCPKCDDLLIEIKERLSTGGD